jgi:hypothetical protein
VATCRFHVRTLTAPEHRRAAATSSAVSDISSGSALSAAHEAAEGLGVGLAHRSRELGLRHEGGHGGIEAARLLGQRLPIRYELR